MPQYCLYILAGMSLEKFANTNTAVYIGVFSEDYRDLLKRDVDVAPLYQETGTGCAIISNRISYIFDLHGPSITVDTACSSSLVAIHLAVQALRNREADQAIVGGVNLILNPDFFCTLSD